MVTGVCDRSLWQLSIYLYQLQVTLMWPCPTNGQSGNKSLNCSKKDRIIRGRGGKINKYPIVLPGGRHSKYFSAEDARIYSSVVLQKAGQHFGSWKKHSRVTTGSPE